MRQLIHIILWIIILFVQASEGDCIVRRINNGNITGAITGPSYFNIRTFAYASDVTFESLPLGSTIPPGEEVFLSCRDGFTFQGKKGESRVPISCREGRWEPDAVCLRIGDFCPTLDDHGIFEISYSKNREKGSTARYFCKDVTNNIVRSQMRTCQDNKEWSGSDDHECTPSMVRCPIIDEDGDFLIVYTNGQKVHSLARYFCKDPTQVILGTRTKLCLDTGEWTGPDNQKCIDSDISCPEIRSTDEFIILYSNGQRIENSIARYFCRNASHQIIGTNSRVCLDTGEWSGLDDQTCREITCPEFPASSNMRVSYSYGLQVGSTATVECAPAPGRYERGFFSTCLSNGTWSQIPPCEDITCPEYPSTDLLFISYTDDRKVGSFAVFYCRPPGQLMGARLSRCLEDGKWEGAVPMCTGEVTCPEIQTTDLIISYTMHRRVGSAANFHCPNASQPVGVSHTRCLENGKWADRIPTCKREITCPEIIVSSQETNLIISYKMDRMVGSFALFRCTPPAQRVGVSRTRCLESGEWADSIPICRNIICQELQQTDLLHISYTDGRKVGSYANFSCTPPARRLGVTHSKCLADGKWADSIPTCSSSNCDFDALMNILPTDVVPATFEFFSMQVPEDFEVELVCEDGLLLKGSPTVKCTSGEWMYEPTLSKPYCSESCILNLEDSSRLIVYPEKEHFFLGEFVHFACPYKYKLTPRVEKALCLSNDWSDPPPNCEPL